MNKKVKKSARSQDDVMPPFMIDDSRVVNLSKDIRKESPKRPTKQLKKTQDTKRALRPRVLEILAKIFQNIAYICIAVGILSVLAAVVVIIMAFWSTNESATIIANPGSSSVSSGGWVWLMISGIAPAFFTVFQIIIGVIGILFVIYMWRKSVRVARKLIWRVADEFLWSLRVVEPVLLLVVYTIAIVSAWWLASAELFVSLTTICLSLLVVGLISFALMRKLSGDNLDFTRGDL